MAKLCGAIVAAAFAAACAHAQTNSQSHASAYVAQRLFEQYSEKSKNSRTTPREYLEKIQANGLPVNKKNTSELLRLLAASRIVGEKVVLIRLLGRQHGMTNPSGLNREIEGALRETTADANSELARSAIISYARLGFMSDTQRILASGFMRKVISDDDYFGELAHLLWSAPKTSQNSVANDIKSGKNKYAREIIAAEFQTAGSGSLLAADARSQILQILAENEPKFSLSIGDFSVSEALEYADWLHAVSTLESEMGARSYNAVVLQHLNKNDVNPKKIIAFLSSDPGKEFMRTSSKKDLVSILGLANQFKQELPLPANENVLLLMGQIDELAMKVQK